MPAPKGLRTIEGVEIGTNVESFLRDVDALEEDTDFGDVDFTGHNPKSPEYEENEIKLELTREALANIMNDYVKEDGVVDEQKLKRFRQIVDKFLEKRTSRKKLEVLYLYARGGDALNVSEEMKKIYSSVKEEFEGEFAPRISEAEPILPAVKTQREDTSGQAAAAVKEKARGGMELDDETKRKLGYRRVGPEEFKSRAKRAKQVGIRTRVVNRDDV